MSIKIEVAKLLIDLDKGKYSNILLNSFFEKNNYPYKERAFVSEVFYGVIRNRIFIEYIIFKHAKKIKKKEILYLLKISVYQGIYMDSDEKGVVWEAVETGKKKYGSKVGNFINGVLRNIFRNYKKIISELEEKKRYDILYSYPKWVVEIFKKKYSDDYINVLKHYKKAAYFSIRINTLKYTSKEFEKYLMENSIKILKKVGKVYYIENAKILASNLIKDGKIFIQDGSSYLPAIVLDARPYDFVLDSCAAPGTKTIVLSESMKNLGEILAVDVHKHKLNLIEENAKKAGVTIIKSKHLDVRKLNRGKYAFDKILLDVPCSGIGVIRKKPETLYRQSFSNVENISKLQYDILDKVSKLLKKNGVLVYSTCTILDIENTDNIKKFLKNNKNFTAEKIELNYDISYEYDEFGGVQINHNDEYLDGFYFIKLKRVD